MTSRGYSAEFCLAETIRFASSPRSVLAKFNDDDLEDFLFAGPEKLTNRACAGFCIT